MRALSSFLLLAVLSTGCSSLHPVVRTALDMPASQGKYVPKKGNNLQPALDALKATLAAEGVTIEEQDEADMNDAFGYSLQEEKHIWMPRVSHTFHINAYFEVLAHEAAHIYQPPAITKMGAEAFAEVVAYEVAKFYGHDMRVSSARYLSAYKESLVFIWAFKHDIKLAVERLTGSNLLK